MLRRSLRLQLVGDGIGARFLLMRLLMTQFKLHLHLPRSGWFVLCLMHHPLYLLLLARLQLVHSVAAVGVFMWFAPNVGDQCS